MRPFLGLRYDDPTTSSAEGVVDISGPIFGSKEAEYSVYRLEGDIENARKLIDSWSSTGVLAQEDKPCIYGFRSGWKSRDGVPHIGGGFIGQGFRTDDPKNDLAPSAVTGPEDDLLALLSACVDMPVAKVTSPEGTHSRLWPIHQQGFIDTVQRLYQLRLDAEGRNETPADAREGLVAIVTDQVPLPPGLVIYPL